MTPTPSTRCIGLRVEPTGVVASRLSHLFFGTALSIAAASCAAYDSPIASAETSAAPAVTPAAARVPDIDERCRTVPGALRRLPSGRSNEAEPVLARPVKGVAFLDPVYGSCIVRVTDHAQEPPVGFARHHYSRRQSFNADGSLLLISARDGYWHLYDARTLAWIQQLRGVAGEAEAQWHPTDPALLAYQTRNGVGMTVQELNVRTGDSRTIGDLAARLRAVWPTANAAWSKSEGSPSADGRYWCLMVDDRDWASLGVITWDRETDTILGMMQTGGVRPDHVSMTPSGNHCVVSTDSAGIGTRAWTPDFKVSTQLHHKSEHSDLALDEAGRDVYVSIDYKSTAGEVFMVDVASGKRTLLFRSYLDGTATALHLSGRAFRAPGWVVVSTYGETGASRQWLHRKIFAVSLTADPVIRTLAHHHSRFNGYWTEPQASVDRQLTRVLFNSNWDVPSEHDIDTYLIVLPEGALK